MTMGCNILLNTPPPKHTKCTPRPPTQKLSRCVYVWGLLQLAHSSERQGES